MLTYEEAAAAVTGLGERFEIETIDVGGVTVKAFKHAPLSLREIFATARDRGDETFLVYEDERWSFAEVMTHIDALASLLVERYGVAPGDRVAVGMRNYPEWVLPSIVTILDAPLPRNAARQVPQASPARPAFRLGGA